MDPYNPASFNHRLEKLSTGKTYHFIDQLPKDGLTPTTPTILCCHGFPDLWYGWRHQIAPWNHAGYRVVVPDMLGYGETDQPKDAVEYSTKNLCADLAALLDLIGVKQSVIIGHDWGAATVWRFALYYPSRVKALVTLSIPYVPPAPVYISPPEMAQRIPNFGYQVYFGDERSTTEIESKLETFLSLMYRFPGTGKSFAKLGQLQSTLANADELQYYLVQYRNGGMLGPLSYYRTNKVRFEEERDHKLQSEVSPSFPVLFVWGTADPTCSTKHVESMRKFVKNLTEVKLDGLGHWLMVEGKDVLADHVLNFLASSGVKAKL
ncbi:alpha/beta-hydrolase [Rickenella mellea]|uniref:Alpha/beta-hydrolase n=1 Tax=Rickenella mellea TaxID=50990 RepID=A0A4R5XGW1_9AGAM|nr:alpha/beta-hydrolase [Rickenella mellea]